MSTIFNHVANAKWSEWATVYASLLATYTYFADRQGRKFLAKTTVSPGFIGAGPNVKDALILTVSNPGERPITLSGWALRLPSKKQLVFRHAGFLPTSFPNKLEPGEKCDVYLSPHLLASELARNGTTGKIKLRAFFRDQLDHTFESKPFQFDVQEWLEQRQG